MIIVIALIGVAVLVVGLVSFDEFDTGREVCGGVSGVLLALSVLSAIVVGIVLSHYGVADQKISMYKEENARIEAHISEMVGRYQEYETGVFSEVSSENALSLVSLYPELKADTLVREQIEIYYKNSEKIKELREDEIDAIVLRWWLFFGK